MVQDCPKCRLVNPPNAQRCDCGYDFASKSMQKSYATGSGGDAGPDGCAKFLGYGLVVIGPLWLAAGLLTAANRGGGGAFGAGVAVGALLPGVLALGFGVYLIRPGRRGR